MKKFLMNYKKKIILLTFTLLGLVLIGFLDKALAVGLLLIFFLFVITFLILLKIGIKDKELYLLLLVVFLIHLAVVLFIYYAEFKPFGGGADYEGYNQTAIEIAQRFKQGNFSLAGIRLGHYFPLLIGIIYIFTLPEMIVGQLFTVWLAALSVLFVYLIVKEISGSKKWAFLIGLIVCFYPSYLYFGSLLLKDTLVIPLVLSGLLLSVKMIKNFSWQKFLIFFVILTGTIHLRFYIGYALIFSFIFCWFLVSALNFKKRVVYGIVIVFLLGFSPQILGNGYYGTNAIKHYFNPEIITVYREVIYAPPETSPPETSPPETSPPETSPPETSPNSLSGLSSSFTAETSFKGYSQTFIYSLLGPFPWQIRYQRQIFALLETIPWYFLFFIIVFGLIKSIRRKGTLEAIKNYQFAVPLLVFAIMSLAALSLFITNFGIIVRIRIPSFIALLCLISLSFNDFNLNNKYLKNIDEYGAKIYEKIFNCRREWFYRFSSHRCFGEKRE